MSNSQEIITCPFCDSVIQDLKNEIYGECEHLFASGETINWNQTIDYVEDIQIIVKHYEKELKSLSFEEKEKNDLWLDIDLWLEKDSDEYEFLNWLDFEIEQNHYDYNSPGYSGIYAFYFHNHWEEKEKELLELLGKLKIFDLIREGVFVKISNEQFEDEKRWGEAYKQQLESKKKEHRLKLNKEIEQINNWYKDGFLESIIEMVNNKTNPYKETYLKVFNKEELRDILIKDIEERYRKKWRPPPID